MIPTYVAYTCFSCGKSIADRPVFVGDWNLHQDCYHSLGGGTLDLEVVRQKLVELSARRVKMVTPQYENKNGGGT